VGSSTLSSFFVSPPSCSDGSLSSINYSFSPAIMVGDVSGFWWRYSSICTPISSICTYFSITTPGLSITSTSPLPYLSSPTTLYCPNSSLIPPLSSLSLSKIVLPLLTTSSYDSFPSFSSTSIVPLAMN
jgi:hypothetical protein